MLFPFAPERPINETLSFLSDIFVHKDGTEQRVSLRQAPRQEWGLTFVMTEEEHQLFENRLFRRLTDAWQLPLWAEPLFLTSTTLSGAATIDVSELAYTDFRQGDSILIYDSEDSYEVIDGVTSSGSTLTLGTNTTLLHIAGTQVYVLRNAFITTPPKVLRYQVNASQYTLQFRSLDNDVDLSDLGTFSTFADKPVLDDPNMIQTNLTEGWEKHLRIIDGLTGVNDVTSDWVSARRTSAKTFSIQSRARLWEVRRLLHWLRGRQRSFYLPTFGRDLTPVADLVSGSSLMDVVHSSYTTDVAHRTPRNVIRVALSSGTVYTRTVNVAAELSSTVERLTVDSPWPANVPMGSIARIDFLEKVRADSDELVISHQDGLGQAVVGFPVKSVLE